MVIYFFNENAFIEITTEKKLLRVVGEIFSFNMSLNNLKTMEKN